MTVTTAHKGRAMRRDLEYLLRRAEQEAIAEIRAVDVIAAERHGIMAQAYRRQALDVMASLPPPPAPA